MPDPRSRARRKEERLRLGRALAWLALAHALGLSILGAGSVSALGPVSGGLAWLFVVCLLPGHFLALALLPLLPCLLLAAWAPRRGVLALAGIGLGLLALAVWIDARVFALYRFHVDGVVWGLLTSGLAHEILPLSAATWLAGAAALVGVALAEAGLVAAAWRLAARPRRVALGGLGALLVGLGLTGQGLHAWADAWSHTPITRLAGAAPWIRPLTAYRWLEARGWVAEAGRPAPPSPGGALRYPLDSPECRPPQPAANLLIVVIEEWRFDELDPVTTPELWRFGEKALRFTRHFSSGNSSRYGLFGLLYGVHGRYWDAFLAEERGPLLVRLALEEGRRFGVFSSASLRHPEFDRTVFADLRGRIPLRAEGGRARERDRWITEAFLGFLDEPDDRPFFGFLYYDSAHSMDHPDDHSGPHRPAAAGVDHLALGPDTDPVPLFNRHRNSIHYVDGLLGRVLDALEARGLMSRTAVVVTGDHGEEFDDTGQNYWGHNSNFSRYQVQVPLLARLPGHPGGAVGELSSHVDVAPTLLRRVFGCAGPASAWSNGRDLTGPGARPYAVVSGRSAGLGIVEAERLTWIAGGAGARVLDHEWRELFGHAPAPELLGRVFQELRAFRAPPGPGSQALQPDPGLGRRAP